MSALTPPLSRLIQELTKLPGIGEKTAPRLAFHLLRTDRHDVEQLAAALIEMRDHTKLCSICLALTADDPCALCQDPQREPDTISVVERPADLVALQPSVQFKDLYHVLHQC